MIVKEIVKIGNKEFNKTYSDAGYMIERDGVQYSEAIDPVGSGREYKETDVKIEE